MAYVDGPRVHEKSTGALSWKLDGTSTKSPDRDIVEIVPHKAAVKEEAKKEFVIVLQRTRPDGEVISGKFYAADDEDLTSNSDKAAVYSTKAAADREAKEANSSWDLKPGEKFVAMELRGKAPWAK